MFGKYFKVAVNVILRYKLFIESLILKLNDIATYGCDR